ncbi:MAG TPA: HAMP domain-containing sensor histidine kinase [Candidatus Saccharimonadales bacterium]
MVLNWLLVGSLGLTLAAFVNALADLLTLQASYLLMRLFIVGGLFAFFGFLLLLSRRYRQRIVPSVVLVAIFFLAATAVVFRWDVINPFGVLLFSLAIVMGGILINARFSLYLAILTGLVLSVCLYGKVHDYWSPNLQWLQQPSRASDVATFSAIYAILALVSWLFNRQMEMALTRAKRSEKAVKRQRDLLEVKVEQRTRALQAAQVEQVQEVYRFAELGHLSTALFHDLANNVMSVSMDIEGLQQGRGSDLLARIQDNVHHIDAVVKRVQRQIRGQGEIERFSVINEVQEVISILAYFSNQMGVTIKLQVPSGRQPITYRGDLMRFRQVVINLLSNAIEAYQDTALAAPERVVAVSVVMLPTGLTLSVVDRGKGISPAAKAKIFEPFYTTKDKGMGIGLFIVKKVIEEDFGGILHVTSKRQTGTTFVATLPLKPR